jgi:hypothetical protein
MVDVGRRQSLAALAALLAGCQENRLATGGATLAADPVVGAGLSISQRVAAFLLTDQNPSLVTLSAPSRIRGVGAVVLSLSCTDCREFWRDDRAAFADALTARGVMAAIVPFPRVPADEAALAALFCASDPADAFVRCMDDLTVSNPRGASAASGVLTAARRAGNPDPACAGRADLGRIIGLNRYFGDRMLGLREVPGIVVGDRIWQGASGLRAARRDLVTS